MLQTFNYSAKHTRTHQIQSLTLSPSYLPQSNFLDSENRVSQNSLALNYSSASMNLSDDNPKLDLDSVRALVKLINVQIQAILQDPEAWNFLLLKSTSKLKIHSQEFFEFSDHSVLSNIFWGIESIDDAIQAQRSEEKTRRLQDSEKMLQIPASLDENGVTWGIPNSYLVCCAYFYLSIVGSLRHNKWQAAMHFLQALLISPSLVQTEFAPVAFQNLFLFCIIHENETTRVTNPGFLEMFDDNEVEDVMRWMARRYKPWLMYYQISGAEIAWQNGDSNPGSADDQSYCIKIKTSRKAEAQVSGEHQNCQSTYLENMDPPSPDEKTKDVLEEQLTRARITIFPHQKKIVTNSEEGSCIETRGSSSIKYLKDILSESQPDTPVSTDSCHSCSIEDCHPEAYEEDSERSQKIKGQRSAEKAQLFNKYLQALSSKSKQENNISSQQSMHVEANEIKAVGCFSARLSTSFSDINLSALDNRDVDIEEQLQLYDYIGSKQNHFSKQCHQRCSRIKKSLSCRATLPDVQIPPEAIFQVDQIGVIEKIISKLCFIEESGNSEEAYPIEMKTMYEMLNNKSGLKYSLLKDVILDQLVMAISTSNEERVVRTSLSMLSTIVLGNKSVVEDIKKKGLQLYDLATALKRNMHEAVILIYLINPSPSEMKTLELFPSLLEVICNSTSYKVGLRSLRLTPPSASLMIIEVLVSASDFETKSMHLAALSSPRVLSGLLQVPRKDNLEEYICLASVLVKCMRFDGKCRKHISETCPVAPFVSLLWTNQKHTTSKVLEFIHELLRIPRSSATDLLKKIQKEGSINNMCALLLLTQNSEPEYKLLAANLLLQLEMLEDISAESIYREAAVEVLVQSLDCEERPNSQSLAAFTLANLGGTYSWTGEPYTMAFLVKRSGLTLLHHKNMIRNVDLSDQSLKDAGVDAWCSKVARRIIQFGLPLFHALEKGLKSKSKRVSRDCLTATAWLGCELVKGQEELRYAACEILLDAIQQYLHPGMELEERILACLCIYNYTSGRGMTKIINLSEGVRESLRRLSNVTWMAEELLKVADYFQPNKWRISCIHRQILEAGYKCSVAVSALIYYRGQLCSGYADGSIKVWDIKGHTATLVQDVKEHKKAVTCFSLYEPGNCLLSGSSDRTIKRWQMVGCSLQCVEVIPMKESIRSMDSWSNLIFVTTQSYKMKVIDESRKPREIFKNKRVKFIKAATGKVYAGCVDSSIQELAVAINRQQEMKVPSKSWTKNKSISSIAIHNDWLYSASLVVEGSKIKDWRKNNKPQISVVPDKGASILAMEVVEDFIYLNCSTSMSTLQILLRGTQQKVGRLSAGSKITSLLSANDMVLCGTETGLIKGWIPL